MVVFVTLSATITNPSSTGMMGTQYPLESTLFAIGTKPATISAKTGTPNVYRKTNFSNREGGVIGRTIRDLVQKKRYRNEYAKI